MAIHLLVVVLVLSFSLRSCTAAVKILFERSMNTVPRPSVSGFQANARCHKPVDPNLWWLAAQARIYRYVSAWQTQHLIKTKPPNKDMRHLECHAFFSCAPMTNNSSVKTLPPKLSPRVCSLRNYPTHSRWDGRFDTSGWMETSHQSSRATRYSFMYCCPNRKQTLF